MSTRRIRSATIAAAVALAVSATAQAANLYWEGGTADLSSSNYSDGSTTAAPVAGDALYIGANGLATGTGTLTVGKIYIGHNSSPGGGGATAGAGTVTLTAGTITASSGGNGTVNYATIVGDQNPGTLTVDGASTTYTTNGMTVGYGDDLAQSATFNLTNGAKVTVNGGRNLIIGDSPTSGTGLPGSVNVSGGTLKVATALQVGLFAAGSSYTQTGGAANSDNVVVGLNGTDNCSFSLSAGSYTTTSTFNLANSATAQTDHTSASFSGGTVNIVGMNLAAGTASNTSLSFSGNTLFTNSANLTLATDSGSATNTSMTVADAATVNVGNSLFLGRGTSTNTSLTITGGSLTVTNNFLMGTGAAAGGIVVNQSAGAVSTTTAVNASTGAAYNFAVGDTTTGDSTYNLSGTGTLNTVAAGVVGRQHGTGVFNQSGGTANFNNSLHLGDQQPTTTIPIDSALNATGTYNLSGGALNVAVTLAGSTTEALSVAPSGTGTFHVIGDGATMTVTGNMGVYANTSGSNAGTLAYSLEPGESLTEINVSGTATFAAGSILSLDFNGTTPSQNSYDLLTATDIIDNGLTFSAPTNWRYQIVSGGNGEVLRAFAIAIDIHGDTNNDGVVDLTDLNNVLNNFGSTGTGNPGDDNSDGVVDLSDLNAVLNNFGATHGATALNVVPEPASLSLLGLITLPLLSRRRRT